MSYKRKFIILKKELGTKPELGLRGHGKMEVKGLRGILNINIENGEPDNYYNVEFVFGGKPNEILDLGKVFTDEIGRGRGEYAFMQRDLNIGQLIGVLITKDGEVFLGGYINEEDGRMEKYIKFINENPEVADKAEETLIEVEELKVEELEEIQVEEIEDIEEYYEEEIKIEEPEEVVEVEKLDEFEEVVEYEEYKVEEVKEVKQIEEIEEMEEIKESEITEDMEETSLVEDIEEKEEIKEVELVEVKQEKEVDYKAIEKMEKENNKKQTIDYVLSILRFFPYIEPFEFELKGYNWWMVELDSENEYRSFLPYFSYISGGNSKGKYKDKFITCNELMNKYGHYIFGLYNEEEEVKYFVYGIPGRFETEEYPNRGLGGFNTWYQGKNIDGYWIIYIDPMTGQIINPMNPMIPTR